MTRFNVTPLKTATERHSLPRWVFYLLLALTIAFKLWLVQGEEIVGSATQYDALWYVRSASHWYWGTTYDWIAFIRPSAYPLWIAVVHLLHLPLRLAIELLQIGGGLTLLFAFRKLGVNRWSCLAGFLLLCLHPMSFQQNDYTMSDTFYAALFWYVVGGLLLTLATRNGWSALATGVAIAILWHTREEGILLLALLALWIVLFRNIRLIAITSGTALLLIVAVYAVNDQVFRSFARSEMTAPVFQSFYHSLLRIKPAEPKPYAPITMDTLQRAMAVSPTLAKLRGPLEGPIGESWRVETQRRTGTPNEIGVGWIVWATRQSASAVGVFVSPKTSHRFFDKAAREINAACADGRLPTRCVIGGFLDPLAQSGGIQRLPASVLRVAARTFARWTIGPLPDDKVLTPAEKTLYDEMTRRRSAGVGPRHGAAVSFERWIAGTHCIAMVVLHVLALGGVFFLWLSRRRMALNFGPLCAIVLLAGAVLLRAGLLAWLDATAFDATQDRFLFPILPLWSVLLVLVIGCTATAWPNEEKKT
ncbi:MAG: hypothetical protein ABI897_11005 [Spartobacteria bacterium]